MMDGQKTNMKWAMSLTLVWESKHMMFSLCSWVASQVFDLLVTMMYPAFGSCENKYKGW